MVNALCLPTPSICLSASALCQLTHPSFSYSPAHFSLLSSVHVLLLNSYMRSLPVSCGFEIYSISRVWPHHSPRVRSAQNNEVRCLVLSEFMSSHGFFYFMRRYFQHVVHRWVNSFVTLPSATTLLHPFLLWLLPMFMKTCLFVKSVLCPVTQSGVSCE